MNNSPATITVTGTDTGVVTTNTPLTTGELIISSHSHFIADTIYGSHGKFTIEEYGAIAYIQVKINYCNWLMEKI